MSAYAKTIVAAVAACLLAGVTSWQTIAAAAPFRPVDALPIACAVLGAVLVYVVPNVPELPAAKGIVSAVLAALTAVSTVLVGNNAHVDVAAAIVAGLGALATWYVPNLAPELGALGAAAGVAAKAAAGQPVDADDITDALRQLEQLDPAIAQADDHPAPAPAVEDPATVAVLGPSVYDQLVADTAATQAAVTTVIPAQAAPVDPAPPTQPMAAVAAGNPAAAPVGA